MFEMYDYIFIFSAAHLKERGTWIVKPVASSRGRGIFLINHVRYVWTYESKIGANLGKLS